MHLLAQHEYGCLYHTHAVVLVFDISTDIKNNQQSADQWPLRLLVMQTPYHLPSLHFQTLVVPNLD